LIGFALLLQVSSARVRHFNDENVRSIIRLYFDTSYSYNDICGFLFIIFASELGQFLKALGLTRRCQLDSFEDVAKMIVELHRKGFENLGYKAMWNILNTQCRVRVTQDKCANDSESN
jgi:hypothetical protein